MATKRQKIFLVFFISRASLFGLGYSRMFSLSSGDTWISALLGTLIGVMIVYIISKIMNYKSKNDLSRFLNNKLIIKILLIILSLYFISEELTTLINFMTSFFLLNTPGYIIGLCSIIVCLYVISKGLPSILRTTEILFYFCIFIVICSLIILLSYTNINLLLPTATTSPNNLFKSSIIFALYTTIPLITIFNLKNNGKGLIKMYLFSSFMIIILILCILAIFGPELTKVLRFPEYIVLKRIKILSFIEKIESLLSITYIYDNLIMGVLSTYTVKNLLKKNTYEKILFYILLCLTYIITVIFINGNYINALKNYYLTPFIYLIGLFIIIPLFIEAIKKKPKLQIQRDT